MKNILLADIVQIPVDDPVAFTFFIGSMAMLAASVFFFFERSSVSPKWRTSLLVSGLITGIAAIHYFYMRDYYAATGANPTALRYIDWILTVPLMCIEFYLLLRPAGANKSFLWKLILASLWMLVMGYIGEAFTDGSMMWSFTYGALSTIGYLYVLYSAWMGEAAQLASKNSSVAVNKGIRALAWFVLVGWSIYPIGYMAMPGGWLSGILEPSSLDLFYNVADAINKIGFGLVVYGIAISETRREQELLGNSNSTSKVTASTGEVVES